MERKATLKRETNETKIDASINLAGEKAQLIQA